MDIIQESISELNGILKVKVVAQDYMPKVEIALKDYAKKASVPGFRPGMVPKSVVAKRYGKDIVMEQVFTLLEDNVNNYLRENHLNLLESPARMNADEPIEWDMNKEFEFQYELIFLPKFSVEITVDDKLPYEVVKVDDELIDRQMGDVARRYGKMMEPEIVEIGDMLVGD